MKYIVFSILFFLLSSKIFAKSTPYGLAGCGVGTMFWGPRSMQTSAATTNNGILQIPALGIPLPTSQPISILAGIAGCGKGARNIAYLEQYHYMRNNFSSLAKELAQGGGANTKGLARSFGCNQDVQIRFDSVLKEKYLDIFSNPGIQASFEELTEQVSKDEILHQNCLVIRNSVQHLADNH